MHRDIVVVAASRGALPVLKALVANLPRQLPATILVVLHTGSQPSILPELLSGWGKLPASHAIHGETMREGRIYVAPPDRHMVVLGAVLHLLDTAAENFCRPSADPLFRSAAAQCGKRVIGVVLSGELVDGAAGFAAIAACGGYRIVQDPDDCEAPSMPRHALAAAGADRVVRQDELGDAVCTAIRGTRGRDKSSAIFTDYR